MDELSLIVEGIMNKVRKLTVYNKQLKEKIFSLGEEKLMLENDLAAKSERISQLEKDLISLQSASVLEGKDPFMAKQKIEELLREIEKCQVLLNR